MHHVSAEINKEQSKISVTEFFYVNARNQMQVLNKIYEDGNNYL